MPIVLSFSGLRFVAVRCRFISDIYMQGNISAGGVGVPMRVLAELDVARPLPLILSSPTLANQAQQGFWGDVDAGG